MSDPTPVIEEMTPPSAETVQPSTMESTESVEELKARLAAAQKVAEEATTEAKRWRNRVEEENPKRKFSEKPIPVSEEDLDWKIANNSRVSLVKDAYQKHLTELQEIGAKLTTSLKNKALMLAEAETGVMKASSSVSSNDGFPSPTVDRSGTQMPRLSPTDIALKVKPETIKEYRDYVEGRY